MGAIIGPLIAVGLMGYFHSHAMEPSSAFRIVFLLALIPGVAAGISFAFLVRDFAGAGSNSRFLASLRQMPRGFRNFLAGVGVFGLGDFAHALMILAATQLLIPGRGMAHAATLAALLYVGHNVVYAATSYPVGALSDRLGRRGLLATGYLSGTLTALGFVAAFIWQIAAIPYLLGLFALGGFYVAFEEALEGSITADMVEPGVRGTAYGVLGAVNGIGDVGASILVGFLWTAVSPAVAFGYAAVMMLAGGVLIYRLR